MPLTSTNVGDLMAYRRSLVTDGPGVNAGDAHPRISRGDHLLRPAEGRTMADHNRAASRAVRGLNNAGPLPYAKRGTGLRPVDTPEAKR